MKPKKQIGKFFFGLASLILLFPSLAFADLVWPALYLEQRILSWWAITAGLVAEYLFVRALTRFSIRKSVLATICMNLGSTLIGMALIPLLGIGWEFFPGIFLYKIMGLGTFNPVTWIATCLLAILANTLIETLVVRWTFKTKIGPKGFWWLCAANTVSVGLAFGSFWLLPMMP